MSVMMIWTLEVDPERLDEALGLVAERREQVKRHSCRDLRVYQVTNGEEPNHVVAIEEFDSPEHLSAFMESQPKDAEAQATIAKTFAPVGPFTVVGMQTVEEF